MAKKSTEPNWIELCDDIDDGVYDSGLAEIARTIQTRLDVTASRRARRLISHLNKGTRVMLTNGIKPRYLEGMVGTIRKLDVENQAAIIDLDSLPSVGAGRPSNNGPSKRVRIPFINLVIIDDDTIAPSEIDDEEIGDDEDYEDDDELEDDDDDEDDEDDDD